MSHVLVVTMSLGVLVTAACGGGNTAPQSAQQAAGGLEQTAKTAALETGANLLQSKGPISKISM